MVNTFILPRVSVIVPVFNGELFIGNCIEHLFRQSYPKEKTEIIIVDNGSTDKTRDIIQSYGLKFLFASKRNPGAARNEGMRVATGGVLVFIDADCLADKNLILCHVMAHMYFEVVNPRVKIIGGGIKGYNTNYWAICDDFCSWSALHPSLSPKIAVSHPTANLSIRQKLVDTGYFFDEELSSGEDYDFCKRVTRDGYQIYFEPRAFISHINRTSFAKFMSHVKDWTQSERQLRQKGITMTAKLSIVEWGLVYGAVFMEKVLGILYNSVRAKRFHVIFFLPFIIMREFFHSFLLFMVELHYNEDKNREKGAFFNYFRQKFNRNS